MVKNHLLLKELQVAYDQVVAEGVSNEIRSLALCDFVDKYENNQPLREIDASVVAMREADRAEFLAIEEETLKQLSSICNAIRTYAFTNKLTALIKNLDQIDGTIFLSGQCEGLYSELCRIFCALVEDEIDERHHTFASQYGIIACPWPNYRTNSTGKPVYDKGRFECSTFAPSFYRLEKEKSLFEQQQKTRVWYSRDRVIGFSQDYKQVKRGNLKDAEVLDCQYHLQRYFSYTKSILLSSKENDGQSLNSAQEQRDISIKNWFFDEANLKLHLNGKEIEFRDDSCRSKGGSRVSVLKTLCKDDESKRKKWSYDELYEEIYEAEVPSGAEEEVKSSLYEACKGLAERSRESGIIDFIIHKDKTVQINPKYVN